MPLGAVWPGLEDGDVEEIPAAPGSRRRSPLGGRLLGEVMIVKPTPKGKPSCRDDGMTILICITEHVGNMGSACE